MFLGGQLAFTWWASSIKDLEIDEEQVGIYYAHVVQYLIPGWFCNDSMYMLPCLLFTVQIATWQTTN